VDLVTGAEWRSAADRGGVTEPLLFLARDAGAPARMAAAIPAMVRG